MKTAIGVAIFSTWMMLLTALATGHISRATSPDCIVITIGGSVYEICL